MSRVLINIDVSNLREAERFYTEAFSLSVTRRFQGSLELEGLGAPLYLLEKAPGSAALPSGRQTRTYSRHWTPVHLDIVTDDIESALARALAAGAQAESEIHKAAYGRLVLLSDPFGHGLCLIEFNERGYDALL